MLFRSTVRQGALRITGVQPNANAITLAGTSTFETALAAGTAQSYGALTFSGGDATVKSTQVGAAQTLTFASLGAKPIGATANFALSGGDATTNRIVLTGAAANAPLGTGYFFNGSSYAFVDAAGYVRAYGAGDAGYVTPSTYASVATKTATITTTAGLPGQTSIQVDSTTGLLAGQVIKIGRAHV